MFKFKTHRPKNDKYIKRDFSASNYIPYVCHWDSNTILTKSKELLQVIKLGGFSFETADDEDVDIKKSTLNNLFKGISAGNFAITIHTIRRRKTISEKPPSIDPNIKLNYSFAEYLENEWQKKHQTSHSYVNELYITIIKKAEHKGIALLDKLFKKFSSKQDKSTWDQSLYESFEELEETMGRIINTLRDYNPELLGIKYSEKGAYCEILQFLGTLVNCGASNHVMVPTQKIDHYLSTNRLYFGPKSIEINGPSGKRYAGIISIKEYGPTTYAGQFDGFLQMPFEFIMTQSFSFTNRQISITKMQLQQSRMIQAEDKAISQIAEITRALDMAMSGDIAFGDHHLTVTCIESTPKSLENSLAMASVELANGGIIPIREKLNMEACFWAQLPGNYNYLVRKATINSLNLACFAPLHNYPAGKEKNNHWGDAVTVLQTTSGTPFFFNFHLRDVGHTLIIGPTGTGKTVLMNFLCAQAQKFKCRMFFFDKDHGAEIFIRALEGHYTTIETNVPCGFNPLQLPDAPENRTFLLEWMKLLVTINGEALTSDDINILNSAINGNYKLKQEDRRLRNIVPFLGIQVTGSLASRISIWHSDGSHNKVFDNAIDKVNFERANVFGFEMGELLRDPVALAPVLQYLFHRINSSLDGSPTMIVLDEAWALIDNPIFGPKIKDWLKVLRKLNAFVIFATQSVEDASKSSISDTLIQQTATQIFLPNLKATDIYRTSFMLTKREFVLIKNTNPASRFFLLKQGTSAVIARIDLNGMNDIVNVLSGRAETVRLLNSIREEYGDDPDNWLPIYYERVKLL